MRWDLFLSEGALDLEREKNEIDRTMYEGVFPESGRIIPPPDKSLPHPQVAYRAKMKERQLKYLRKMGVQEGNTVDSILSRAEYALNNKNYDKLFEELNKLPKEASVVMDEWRKTFERYLENNS